MHIAYIWGVNMDKLTMAHEFYIANKDNYIGTSFSDIAKQCFGYANAMQAEADKCNKAEAEQKRKEMRELLNANNTFLEKEGQHFDDVLNPLNSMELESKLDGCEHSARSLAGFCIHCGKNTVMNQD